MRAHDGANAPSLVIRDALLRNDPQVKRAGAKGRPNDFANGRAADEFLNENRGRTTKPTQPGALQRAASPTGAPLIQPTGARRTEFSTKSTAGRQNPGDMGRLSKPAGRTARCNKKPPPKRGFP
jgi:hypothetical protein